MQLSSKVMKNKDDIQIQAKTAARIETYDSLFFLIHPVTVILPYQYIVASFYAFLHQIFASLRTQHLAKLCKDL